MNIVRENEILVVTQTQVSISYYKRQQWQKFENVKIIVSSISEAISERKYLTFQKMYGFRNFTAQKTRAAHFAFCP